MDQPTIDGVNTWFVSKAAREFGLKDGISGVGGDELLGGYSTFRLSPRLARWLRIPSKLPALPAIFEKLVQTSRALGIGLHPKAAGLMRYGGSLFGAYILQRALFLPAELHAVIEDAEFLRTGLTRLNPLGMLEGSLKGEAGSAFGQLAMLESCFYLRNSAAQGHRLDGHGPFARNSHAPCRPCLVEPRGPLADAAGTSGRQAFASERASETAAQRDPESQEDLASASPSSPGSAGC